MREHDPQTSELWDLGRELLESGIAQGIKCYISDEGNRLIAEIETADGIKKVPYLMPYPTGNIEHDLSIMERKLVDEIKVAFALDSTFDKLDQLKELGKLPE